LVKGLDMAVERVCGRWRRRLQERLDGALGAQESAGLEAHLVGCGACRTVSFELVGLEALLGDDPLDVPPARLRADILSVVERARVEDLRIRRVALTATALAGALLLALFTEPLVELGALLEALPEELAGWLSFELELGLLGELAQGLEAAAPAAPLALLMAFPLFAALNVVALRGLEPRHA
jgi:predicted anti-sigma-YlaC factor YlaD